jgi:uncharacterized protein (TIGR02266 family)
VELPVQKRIPLRIRLPYENEAEFVLRYGHHVSLRTIFIATRAPKPVGSLLTFELVLKDGQRLMRGEGEVTEISTDTTPGVGGMLIHISRVDAATQELIERLLAAPVDDQIVEHANVEEQQQDNTNDSSVEDNTTKQLGPSAETLAPKALECVMACWSPTGWGVLEFEAESTLFESTQLVLLPEHVASLVELLKRIGLQTKRLTLACPAQLPPMRRSDFAEAAKGHFESIDFVHYSSALALLASRNKGFARKRMLSIVCQGLEVEALLSNISGDDIENTGCVGFIAASADECVEQLGLSLLKALKLEWNSIDHISAFGCGIELQSRLEVLTGKPVVHVENALLLGAQLAFEAQQNKSKGQSHQRLTEALSAAVSLADTNGALVPIFDVFTRLPTEKSHRVVAKKDVAVALPLIWGPDVNDGFQMTATTTAGRDCEVTFRFSISDQHAIAVSASDDHARDLKVFLTADRASSLVGTKPKLGILGGIRRAFARK